MNAEFKETREKFEVEITKKTSEVSLLQKELANVREFRKDKAQITSELRDLYEQLEFQKNENNEIQNKMDQKFFIEKIKMEREVCYDKLTHTVRQHLIVDVLMVGFSRA